MHETMTVPVAFERLNIDDTTGALEGLQMLNDAIRRAWPGVERFSFHYSKMDPHEAYSLAKRGETFWNVLQKGRLVIYSVEGCEGYWVHVDVYQSDGMNGFKVRQVLTMKVFGDLFLAQQITNLTQFLIGG